MRIVDVCAFYSPHGGGVKTYVERKLKALPALGHEIIVLAPGRYDSVIRRGPGALLVTVAQPALPVDRRYHYFTDRSAIHDALDAWQPDFVEASSPWSSATKVAEWQGTAPRALMMHADPLSSYAYRWLGGVASRARIDRMCGRFWAHLRALDRRFDLVVSPGASLSRRMRAGGLEKMVTVPLGVEPGVFGPGKADPAVRRALLDQLQLPDDGVILIGVGRFAGEKRWAMVVGAASVAARRRPVGMVLIGEGKERERIARAGNGSPHVAILPPTSDRAELATLLASGDALVHGCESETFCLVASEARASGLPIIVPDRGGAYDQLGAGGGLAYRATEAASLTEAIVRLVDTPDAFGPRALAASRVRTMDQHFRDLVGRYAALVPGAEAIEEWPAALDRWPTTVNG